MPVVNANSVDPDQTPRSAASDLGLHCLPMSHLWDARYKWVNQVRIRSPYPYHVLKFDQVHFADTCFKILLDE